MGIPLPLLLTGWGQVLEGVGGIGGERPLPLPLQVERPRGPGHIVSSAWA